MHKIDAAVFLPSHSSGVDGVPSAVSIMLAQQMLLLKLSSTDFHAQPALVSGAGFGLSCFPSQPLKRIPRDGSVVIYPPALPSLGNACEWSTTSSIVA